MSDLQEELPIDDVAIMRKLDELASERAAYAAIEVESASIIEKLLGERYPEYLSAMELISSRKEAVAKVISSLEDEVKAAAASGKCTYSGSTLQVVWKNGNSGWDGQALLELGKSNPEILACATRGNPSVSIREIKKKEKS
jgi:hypothetical protein